MPDQPTHPRLKRRGLLTTAASALGAPAIAFGQGQNGVALVIGNSKYLWEASLPNVRRDAPDVAQRFKALGMRTELVLDAGRAEMRTAIDKFATAARGARFAAFYFAGHGASWENDTYLVAVDGDLGNPRNVQEFLPTRAVAVAMQEAQNRLLVFDNCRNNPADGWRQRAAMAASRMTKTELAASQFQGPNTLVIFSTAPGRVAVDGPAGQNSPFATAFMRQLEGPAVDLRTLSAKLRRDLMIATDGQQVLWDQNTYSAPFLLPTTDKRSAGAPSSSSEIVELPNAYAFARQNGLLLPEGLVALRPNSGTPHRSKIGAFATKSMIVIVVSVSDNTAEVICSLRDRVATYDGGSNDFIWRYTTGTLSERELQFSLGRLNGSSELPLYFRWRDANSGTYINRRNTSGQNMSAQPAHYVDFSRLD
jgi:hypothetical protein